MSAEIARCQHIRLEGTQCGSPALRGQQLCYYHDQMHTRLSRKARRKRRTSKNWSLPILEDATSVQAALMQTMHAIVDETLDRRTGALVLYGLQTAAINLKRIREPLWDDVVI